jgi:hypothetical protein
VRYFGLDRDITIGRNVKVLRKSCFEGCKYLDRIDFEIGSELERIGPAALRDCESLARIEIPSSVERIEEASFEGCTELESFLMAKDSSVVTIGARAFAKCTSLRSFGTSPQIGEIGSNSFSECIYLYRFKFTSSESLKRVLAERSLDEALHELGVSVSSSLFSIEIDDAEVKLKFPGWSYVVGGGEGDVQLSLVREIQ